MQIHVAKNGQQTGPFEETQIREKLAAGEFAPTDLAWHADLAGWQPLSTLFPEATGGPAPAASPVAAIPVFPPAPTFAAEPPMASSLPPPAPFAMPPPAGGGYAPLPVAGLPGQLTPPQFYNPGAVGDTNLAGAGARFLGALVDTILAIICMAPGYSLIIIGSLAKDAEGNPTGGGTTALGTVGYLVGGLIYLGIQAFLLTRSGQSVGKKVVGTRVVRLDGSPAGFVGAFLMRSIVGYLPGVLCGIYSIVDACYVFRQDRRCIHDLIAGTKVVRA